MALYAFDGTWNKPDTVDDGTDRNTNVYSFLKFYAVQDGQARADLEAYKMGVGTRFGEPGRIVGGFFGAGGRARIDEMVDSFRQNWRLDQGESRTVDVIGFSRGAALALHFCNTLAAGVDVDGQKVTPDIRFLGLWDVVPSFGLPGVFIKELHETNLGWQLDVPATVKHCYHAMALDEHRGAFDVHRLDPEGDDRPRIEEWWFRGTHSDVGGGKGNVERSNITLVWMLERAVQCGLPIAFEGAAGLPRRDEAAVSHGKRQGTEIDRAVLKDDFIHRSAGTILEVGQSLDVDVDSRLWFDFSGVLVSAGATYLFTPDPQGRWTDKTIECDASGWPKSLDRGKTVLGWFHTKVLQSAPLTLTKRVTGANWFEMVAAVGTDGKTTVPIGGGQHAQSPWTAPTSGPLFFFANDARLSGFGHDFYQNNKGGIVVRVQRVG